MASVWYIGTNDAKGITPADWTRLGLLPAIDARWDFDNGWSIVRSTFTTEQLAYLATQFDFAVNSPDTRRQPEVDNPYLSDPGAVSDLPPGYENLLPKPKDAGTPGEVLTLGSDGFTPEWDAPTGGGTSGRVTLTNVLHNEGDSISFGKGQTDAQKWGRTVATALGCTYDGRGQGGQTTSETALRAGALDMVMSAPVTIPSAVTAVPLTFSTTGDWFADVYTFIGVITDTTGAMVVGTLTHDALGDVTVPTPTGWTFTRAATGEALSLSAGAVFHCTEADNDLGAVWMILVGTNNYQGAASAGNGTNVIRDLDLIVKRLEAAGNRRYIIFGTHIRPGDGAAPERIAGKTLNNAIGAQRYGNHWVDWQGFLVGPGMAFEGLTPNAGDLSDIAAGKCPSALLDPDGTHPANPQGWDILISLAIQTFAKNGYVVGAKPVIAQGFKAADLPVVSGITATSFTMTPVANTTVHGWHTQYRKAATPGTVYEGPNTTGVVPATVTALDPGTAYECRLIPVTVLGYGTPTAWVAVSTTGTAPVTLASDAFTAADGTQINGRTLDNGAGGTGTRAWTATNTFGTVVGNAATESNVGGRVTTTLADIGVAYGYTEILITALPAVGSLMGAYIRCTAAGSGYVSVTIGGDGAVQLKKHDGTTLTLVVGLPAGSAKVADKVGVRATQNATTPSQTDLAVLINGAVVLTGTDTVVPAGTKAGFNLTTSAAIDQIVIKDK